MVVIVGNVDVGLSVHRVGSSHRSDSTAYGLSSSKSGVSWPTGHKRDTVELSTRELVDHEGFKGVAVGVRQNVSEDSIEQTIPRATH